jgi:light-regulated signal transduction histidine kinase (bacteriophytochrome)
MGRAARAPLFERALQRARGKISVKSTLGKGTTFTVKTPVDPETIETRDVWVNQPVEVQLHRWK